MRTYLSLSIVAFTLATPAFAADGAPGPAPAIDPNVAPCTKVTATEIEEFVGAPARIIETNPFLCRWQAGEEEKYAQVTLIPKETIGAPAGKERAYFDQSIGGERDRSKPGEMIELQGIGESAWALKLADNPTNFHQIYFFKNLKTGTVATNGVGYEATVELARRAAARF